MYHSFLIHSFTDGHLGCFQHLTILNCAAMNIGVHRFVWIGVSGFSSHPTTAFNKIYTSLMELNFNALNTAGFLLLLTLSSSSSPGCLRFLSTFLKIYWFLEKETETSVSCSTYLCIHWLILLCVRTRDWTYNLGITGRHFNQPCYLARASGFFSDVTPRRKSLHWPFQFWLVAVPPASAALWASSPQTYPMGQQRTPAYPHLPLSSLTARMESHLPLLYPQTLAQPVT